MTTKAHTGTTQSNPRLLLRDELVSPQLSHRHLHLVRVLRRGGAVLLTVRERPEPLELKLTAKLHQVVVLLLRLPWKSRDERGAQR